QALGLELHVLPARTVSDIDDAFSTLTRLRAGALIVSVDPFLTNNRSLIVSLAARHSVPAMYGWREFATAGGVMGYVTSLTTSHGQPAINAGQILKGAQPVDLPVQQVVKIELVLNLITARTLGLSFPLPLLGRADEVIE